MIMKKTVFTFALLLILGIGNSTAQTNEAKPFEGEIVSKVNSYQKVKTKLKTKNIIAKMIAGSIIKKNVDNNPDFYNGICTTTLLIKGSKIREHHGGKNSVTITQTDGNVTKTAIYYPYIKKGYYFTDAANNATGEGGTTIGGVTINQSKIEKTGEMMVDSYKCDVYKVKYELVSDTLDNHAVTNVHCEWAVIPDSVTARKGNTPLENSRALKSTSNIVLQSTSEMLNMDMQFNISSTLKKITMRPVDDSEFEIPADIKMVDINKKPKEMIKIIQENAKYLKKNGLWQEAPDEAPKIYDNLSEDWDY